MLTKVIVYLLTKSFKSLLDKWCKIPTQQPVSKIMTNQELLQRQKEITQLMESKYSLLKNRQEEVKEIEIIIAGLQSQINTIDKELADNSK